MNRQQKIAKLKNLIAGTIKPLDGVTLCWSLEDDGLYHCENPKYEHLKYNREQLTAFTEKNGGHHLLFVSFAGSEMDTIRDSRNPQRKDEPILEDSPNDRLFTWHEEKVYEDEPQPEAIIEPTPPNEPVIAPEPTKKPKQPKKKRAASKPQLTRAEANKIKAKADYQKCLAQMELDKQRMENMNEFNRINKDFFQ
jgi:hypothetical protein